MTDLDLPKYVFGKSIRREFIPYENGEPFDLPTQTPTIYLFSAQPTVAEALAGTSAISSHTLSSWVESHGKPYQRTYTFPAINSADNESLEFWEAIKYVLTGSGTSHVTIRYFEVGATEAPDSYPHVSRSDIIGIFPAITAYLTEVQLNTFIEAAQVSIKTDVEARGFRWERLYRQEKLRLAINYRTISLAELSQVKEQGDRHFIRYQEFETKTQAVLESLSLPYDADGDSIPEGVMAVQPQSWRVIR